MTATPVLFRAALESLYTQEGLPPFLKMAAECLDAVFETANAKRSISRKEAVAALTQLPVYKGTPYENADGWKDTDLNLIRDAYNRHIAKGDRSRMISEVAENEPKPMPKNPATQQAAPQATPQPQPKPQQQPQQPKVAPQPVQNTQTTNNPATRQNTNATQQQNNTSVQQPQPAPSQQQQPKTTTQTTTPSNTRSAQHGTQNRAPVPQQQPSASSSTATASSSSGAKQQKSQTPKGNSVSCRSIYDRVKNPNACKDRIL